MDVIYGGGNSHAPRAKVSGAPRHFGHSDNTTPYWPKGSRAIGREYLIRAPSVDMVGGAPLTHTDLSIPRGGLPGLSFTGLSLVNF